MQDSCFSESYRYGRGPFLNSCGLTIALVKEEISTSPTPDVSSSKLESSDIEEHASFSSGVDEVPGVSI